MTHRSDTIASVMPTADAVIMRRMASAAVRDGRAAWRMASAQPTLTNLRAAFRACVLASRALRRAASVLPAEASAMIEEADRVDAAADELKERLVSMPGWNETTATR